MKTARFIGTVLLLIVLSGCGSRKALVRTHCAERDSITEIRHNEVINTRQHAGEQAEIAEEYREETTLVISKDTAEVKITRSIISRKAQNTKSRQWQEKQQQTDTSQDIRKQTRTKESEKETQKSNRSVTSYIIILGGILLLLLLLFRRKFHL